MKSKNVKLPVLGAIAATRGLLGFGAGLLMAKKIKQRRRKMVGWTLLGLGVASTIPLAALVLRSGSSDARIVTPADASTVGA
jgi:hypothetical protein